MRDQFRYTLKIGKIESWSGFKLFQLYFFAIDCPWLRTIGSFLRVTKIDTALHIWNLIFYALQYQSCINRYFLLNSYYSPDM